MSEHITIEKTLYDDIVKENVLLQKKLLGVDDMNIKLLSKNAKKPTRKNPTDSGLDLYVSEGTIIPAGQTVVVPTDISAELPLNFEGQIRSRSSVSLEGKLLVHLGTIDHIYHKPLGIITTNLTDKDIFVEQHQRIAQLVVSPVLYPQLNIVSKFDFESQRGGFGSTGR